MGYQWKPIEDIQNWEELASTELQNLAVVWTEEAEKLRKSNALKEFNERLSREWAIETGIIERLYSIDRGTTYMLIERGLEASLIEHGSTDKSPEKVIQMLRDHKDAIEGLFDFVNQKRSLSTSYIKELHAVLTRSQKSILAYHEETKQWGEIELIKGDYKKWPNNPKRDNETHEYAPPEQTASEMDRLIALHIQHMKIGISPEVEASWLHHRFTQIHPFQDGNGRVARALVALVFLRVGWFPVVVDRDHRDIYINTLEQADSGDLKPLVDFFAGLQKKTILRALSHSEEILRPPALQQIISAVDEKLNARRIAQEQRYRAVFDISRKVEDITKQRIEDLAIELDQTLEEHGYRAFFDLSIEGNNYWFRQDIIETAKKLDYFADTRTYATWVRLKINEERQVHLVISFHALGTKFVGVMAASAFIKYRDQEGENGESMSEAPSPICREVFQFTYNETSEDVEKRFKIWLEDSLFVGLENWRSQL